MSDICAGKASSTYVPPYVPFFHITHTKLDVGEWVGAGSLRREFTWTSSLQPPITSSM